MGGGKSGTTIQKTEIPPEVMARYNAVNARAETAAAKPFQRYEGQFVAPLTGTQSGAIQNITQTGGMTAPYFGAATALTAAGAQDVGPLTSGQIGYYMNPFLGAVADPTLRALQQQQAQERMSLQAQAIRSGAFGGDRAGLERANLARQQALGTAQAMMPIFAQGYDKAVSTAAGQQGVVAADLARRMQAGQQFAGLGTGAQAAALQQGQAQMAAGMAEQQTQQADLTARYQQFLQERGYDFQTAQFLANIAMGTGALSGSTTTTQAPMPFFSDRRLKKDIDMVATTKDGLPVYDFKYKGDDEPHRGYMAQDVEKKYPDAVGLAGGYKTVDYNKVAEHQAEKGLGPAISASSMGGPVHESYGPRERFAPGGPISQYSPEDWRSLLEMQTKGFGPFAQGGIYGAKPGQTPFQGGLTYVPKGDLAVARLQPHAAPPRMAEGMGAQGIKGISMLSDVTEAVTGKGLGRRVGEALNLYDPPRAGASDKNAPTGGDANKKVATGAGSPAPASTDAGSSAVTKTSSVFGDEPAVMFGNAGGVVPSRNHYAGGGISAMPYASTDQTFDLGALNAENMKTPQELAKQQKDMSGGAGGAGGQSQTGLGLGDVAAIANLGKMAFAAFSDARLKDNIRHVGKTFDNQNIYAYDMGDGETKLGLMAQEVMRRKPEAVGERDGFLTLDYDKATEDTAMPPKTGGIMPREGLQRGGPPDERASLFSSLEEEYGLPSGYLARTHQIESSGGRNLVNPTSSARGHFQFMPATAREMGVEDPMDLAQSARGAAAYAAQNMERLRRAGIEQPTGAHLYLAHQQGPGGATGLLQGADRPASDIVGRAAVTGNRGDLGMTGSDFANRIMAMYEGKEAPAGGLGAGRQTQAEGKAPQGGVKGFFQENKGVILPILAGLGSMAQSRSPFLGGAILEGIGGGARAYVDMGRELAGTALTEQQTETQKTVTASNLQQIAQNAMFEKNGKRYVMTTNGPMLEGDWIQSALSGNQVPLLGYEQYKQAVEKIGGTPISQQSLSEGRAAAGVSGEKPAGEAKPAREPVLFGQGGERAASQDFDTSLYADKETMAERRALSQQTEKDVLAGYRTAQASGDRLNQLASMLLKLPDQGVTATGAMAPQFIAGADFWNDAVRRAPLLSKETRDALSIKPDDIASGNAFKKITEGMRFAQAQGADQRSLGALSAAAEAVPRISLDKDSNIKILAGLYRDKQRLIDQRTYMNEYKDYMRRAYGPTYAERYLAQNALDAFGEDVSADRYGNEEEAFIKFLRQKKKDGSHAALDVLQGKPVNRQYLDQAFREYYNAPHLRRYFENR